MKRHAFLVGVFVVLALALAVAGILTLNKSGLFTNRHAAVVYFDGSVKGLYIGAPVTFRGVKMGEVTRIDVQVNPQTLLTRVSVRLTLNTENLQMGSLEGPNENLDLPDLIKRGLRARLILQSIVTGQAAVELDFRPDTPAKVATVGSPSLPEIPTMQDKLDALINQVQSLPLGDLVAELRQTMTTLNQTLKASQMAIDSSSKQINATSSQARQTLESIAGHGSGTDPSQQHAEVHPAVERHHPRRRHRSPTGFAANPAGDQTSRRTSPPGHARSG